MPELTTGEKILKTSAITDEDKDTMKEVKKLYAKIIDILSELPPEPDPSEKLRITRIAIQEAEGAAMWANKAITWKAK